MMACSLQRVHDFERTSGLTTATPSKRGGAQLKSIQWAAGGFLAFGLMAYLFFKWFIPNSRWEDYQYLVWGAAVVGGAVGLLAARSSSSAPKSPAKEMK
jgi:hypothetical protein